MKLIEIIFWISFLFILYAYVGYLGILKVISIFKKQEVKKGFVDAAVSFIITAHNEEHRIRQKIENTLAQDYPRDKFEIIIASDCSTDRTDEIVKCYRSKGIKLIRAIERHGKENAQKLGVEAASGQIIIFSDVATNLHRDGVSKIIGNFSDPTVGCVSSEDSFVDPDGRRSGEGAYVRYEMLLRSLETKVNTLVGLSGSFFAARRVVCQNWASDLQSDFNTLLNSVKLGLRGVSDPESIGYYENIADEKKEFDRKVRTVLRGISVFMSSLTLLNPFQYGLFSWQLFSHKLCRWLVPLALIVVFLCNAFLLMDGNLYFGIFLFQLGFYLLAFWGLWGPLFPRRNILMVPVFFVMVNLSILFAWLKYLKGERVIAWEPSKRKVGSHLNEMP